MLGEHCDWALVESRFSSLVEVYWEMESEPHEPEFHCEHLVGILILLGSTVHDN